MAVVDFRESRSGRPTNVARSAGTLPTDGGLFVGVLVGVILIVGGLTYLPALSLGPVAEHFAMRAGVNY